MSKNFTRSCYASKSTLRRIDDIILGRNKYAPAAIARRAAKRLLRFRAPHEVKGEI